MKKYGLLIILIIIGIVIIILNKDDRNYIKVGNLYISEIVASNKNTYQSSDMEYYDYLEIYNGNNYDINLSGYYLTDNLAEFKKWSFPDVTIYSHEYLIVLASGVNICDNKELCHTNFKLSKDGEIVTLIDKSGNIISRVTYPKLNSDISYSYINGKYEITLPTPGKENVLSILKNKENKNYQLEITEYMTHNKGMNYLTNGKYYDWIEIHNLGDDISLLNLSLSDEFDNLDKYIFDDVIIKKDEYKVIYLTGGDKIDNYLCANFKLSDNDEELILSFDNKVLDSVKIVKLEDNMSYGKLDNKWYYFYLPTPGSSNDTSKVEVIDFGNSQDAST